MPIPARVSILCGDLQVKSCLHALGHHIDYYCFSVGNCHCPPGRPFALLGNDMCGFAAVDTLTNDIRYDGGRHSGTLSNAYQVSFQQTCHAIVSLWANSGFPGLRISQVTLERLHTRLTEKWLASLKKMPNEKHLRSMTDDFARQAADIARNLRIEQTKKEWPFPLPNKNLPAIFASRN